jgi:hypothetical protein
MKGSGTPGAQPSDAGAQGVQTSDSAASDAPTSDAGRPGAQPNDTGAPDAPTSDAAVDAEPGHAIVSAQPTWQLVQFVSTGQSLSVGWGASVLSTVETSGNLALHDSSGAYDITNPNAPTLSLVPNAGPIRTITDGTSPYPNNIAGETPDSRFADQVTALTGGWTLVQTTAGQSGESMSVIQKGGTGNAYAASLYEVAAAHRLAAAEGKTHGVGCVLLTHGEADADLQTSASAYAADLAALHDAYQADVQALTGQTSPVPMLLTQQGSSPGIGAGENTTALGMLIAAQANPGAVVLVGPKYQYDYLVPNLHLLGPSYRLLGEKYAEAYVAIAGGGSWEPLWPTAIVSSGTNLTVSFHVPAPPLVFDAAAPQPHQAGALAAWAGGRGFEVSDTFLTGTVMNVSDTNPIVITMDTDLPATLATGEALTLENVWMGDTPSAQAINTTWTVTVTGPKTFALDGSTALDAGPGGSPLSRIFEAVGVTGARIDGDDVVLSLARAPRSDVIVGYAHTPDLTTWQGQTGGFIGGAGRMGDLRDSDRFAGISGTVQPNWAVEFSEALMQ